MSDRRTDGEVGSPTIAQISIEKKPILKMTKSPQFKNDTESTPADTMDTQSVIQRRQQLCD
jgi:hypothetical protein